jgi:hypothetical protein
MRLRERSLGRPSEYVRLCYANAIYRVGRRTRFRLLAFSARQPWASRDRNRTENGAHVG